jgi:hypothetical protein
MIAAFAITGKTLPEERIADIRANYAAFQACQLDEREAGRKHRRNATIDLVPPPPSAVLLQSADDVIAACEAMKALSEEQKLAERAKFAAAQGAGQGRKSPEQTSP